MGFFKRGFCDLGLGGLERGSWRGVGEGLGKAWLSVGLGRAWLSVIQKPRLENPVNGRRDATSPVPGINGTKCRFYCGIQQKTAVCPREGCRFVPGKGPWFVPETPSRPKYLCLLVP